MAGGIFKRRPFYFNPKCVAFSFLTMLAYWRLVRDPNPYTMPIIAIGAYIAMAWYDKAYHCDAALESTTAGMESDPTASDRVTTRTNSYMRWVYLIHLLIIGPLLLYVGLRGNNADPRVHGAVLGMAVIAILYHGQKLVWG